MRGIRSGRGVVALLAATGIASCGGGSSSVMGTGVPVLQMAVTASGNAQTGTAGGSLANPLRVQVLLDGSPQDGDTVTWTASGAGASFAPLRSATDINGIAATSWTLGTVAGAQTATAMLAGPTSSPVTFTATAIAGAPSVLSLAAGNSQTGGVGDTLAKRLSVLATDRFGNPVHGVAVTWSVSGSGSVTPTSDTTAVDGMAQATLTLGTAAGTDTVSAAATGLTGSPEVFLETALVPPPAAAVQVGDIFFKSSRNGTENPAVDTVAVGGTVTWTWSGALGHSVQSLNTPSFASSTTRSSGTYAVTFGAAGTYHYDCAPHGMQMTGTVVVE